MSVELLEAARGDLCVEALGNQLQAAGFHHRPERCIRWRLSSTDSSLHLGLYVTLQHDNEPLGMSDLKEFTSEYNDRKKKKKTTS